MRKLFLLGLIVMLSLSITTFASAAVFTFSPTADGYANVAGGSYPMTLLNIYAGKTNSATNVYRSALKFNLGSIPDDYVVTSAVLNLNGAEQGNTYGTPSFDLIRSANDNWAESNSLITGVVTQNPLGTTLLSGKTDYKGLSSWDLMANNNWNYALDLVDNQLTLIIKGVNETTNYQTYSWYSSNNATLKPLLTINADVAPVPEPMTLTLFAIGGAGLAAMRRRKKAA